MNTEKVPGTFSGSGRRAARKRFLAPLLCAALLLGVTAGAAALRLADLDNRPMHCDEGNQAVKFGLLLERGEYDYDPQEHHGPSLCLLTLPIAWLAGAEKLSELSEIHLRLLPGIFGVVLVGMVWLLRNEIGYAAALCAAVLTAVSPAMVFFSRYYIQEMLLVCFTFGAIVALRRSARHLAPEASEEPGHRPGTDRAPTQSVGRRWSALVGTDRVWVRRAFWLVLLGFSVGMMHASKETCVIALFAIALAAAVAFGDLRRAGWKVLLISGLVVSITATSLSALMFSSFLKKQEKKREAVIESYAAYSHYLKRTSGEGSAGPHDQPWYHYFHRLFWWRRNSGPVWSEAAIGLLALVGLVAGVWGRGLNPAHLPMVRFLGVYTVLMTVVYSAIPYKTPWCALGFLHGMILLAGVAAVVLVRAAPGYLLKTTVVAGLVAAAGHLGWQAYRASFVAYEDPGNPYVYAHTTSDVPLLAERIKEIAALHPDGRAMHIQVICPDDDYWPLPWYLRGLGRVGWFSHVPNGPPAPLIITQPRLTDPVPESFGVTQPSGRRSAYVPAVPDQEKRDWQIRPYTPLQLHVRGDLWDEFIVHEDPRHPRLRAATTSDVQPMVRAVERIAARYAEAEDSNALEMPILVVCPDHDFWPLPWYLRAFRRVRWLDEVPDAKDPSAPPAAPLIITKPTTEDAVVEYAYAKHVPGEPILRQSLRKEGNADWQLRPNVWLRVNVRYDLWEASGANGTK